MSNMPGVGEFCWASPRSPQPTWAFDLSTALFQNSAANSKTTPTMPAAVDDLTGDRSSLATQATQVTAGE
jgi:hypothetical protein